MAEVFTRALGQGPYLKSPPKKKPAWEGRFNDRRQEGALVRLCRLHDIGLGQNNAALLD